MQLEYEIASILMMQKCEGFTLLELIVVITIIGMFAGFAAPSLSQWRQQQRFENDVQKTMEALSDVRAMALAEKECDGAVAVRWMAQVDLNGTTVSCEKEGGSEITVSSFPWESDLSVVTERTSIIPSSPTLPTWTSETPLGISIFPGGTQSRIGTGYTPKWARIKLTSVGAGKEKTICFSRVANYPFISSGECNDD